MRAYIHTKARRADGTFDCYLTQEAEVKEKPLPWQLAGLQYTASGYGARIPTRYMVRYNGRWRRVYCITYSNNGTLFIGNKFDPCLTVQIDRV